MVTCRAAGQRSGRRALPRVRGTSSSWQEASATGQADSHHAEAAARVCHCCGLTAPSSSAMLAMSGARYMMLSARTTP